MMLMGQGLAAVVAAMVAAAVVKPRVLPGRLLLLVGRMLTWRWW